MTSQLPYMWFLVTVFLVFYIFLVDSNVGLFILYACKLAWIKLRTSLILLTLAPRIKYDQFQLKRTINSPSFQLKRIRALEHRIEALEGAAKLPEKRYNLSDYTLDK